MRRWNNEIDEIRWRKAGVGNGSMSLKDYHVERYLCALLYMKAMCKITNNEGKSARWLKVPGLKNMGTCTCTIL